MRRRKPFYNLNKNATQRVNLIKISRQKDPSLREKARDGFTNI